MVLRVALDCRLVNVLALVGSLVACSGSDSTDGSKTTHMPDGLPGVYAGDFPCSNCAAIAATLWLRPDGRFFLRQSYVEADGTADGSSSYALGRWRWDDAAAFIVLTGAGPQRRFSWVDQQRLKLHTVSTVEHLLTRDPLAPPFADRLRLDGESTIIEGNAVFTECLTGLQFQIAKDGGFNELRRRHRVVNSRGKVALTSVDARITEVAAGDAVAELLVIDRVVDLKPGVGC